MHLCQVRRAKIIVISHFQVRLHPRIDNHVQPSVNVNSVPHPRRRPLLVDSASTGISSLSQGNSGKRSLWSTVASRVEAFLAQQSFMEGPTGNASPCCTEA